MTFPTIQHMPPHLTRQTLILSFISIFWQAIPFKNNHKTSLNMSLKQFRFLTLIGILLFGVGCRFYQTSPLSIYKVRKISGIHKKNRHFFLIDEEHDLSEVWELKHCHFDKTTVSARLTKLDPKFAADSILVTKDVPPDVFKNRVYLYATPNLVRQLSSSTDSIQFSYNDLSSISVVEIDIKKTSFRNASILGTVLLLAFGIGSNN